MKRVTATGRELLGALETFRDVLTTQSIRAKHAGSESDRARVLIFAVVALAAALRFATLDLQSFWLDEAITAGLVQRPFHGLLQGIADSESTPPLFYVLAWGWGKVFGTGELGLRSLSAVAGTLTVPVIYATGRRLFSARVAVIAAVIVAVHPMLIWYSQEARAYALLALFSAIALLFFVRAVAAPTRPNLAGWAASSCLALATHYFAVFPFVTEAAVLLVCARRRRPVLLVMAAPIATGCLLLPLAIHQRGAGLTSWIGAPLGERVDYTAAQFIVGGPVAHIRALTAVLLVVLAAVALFASEPKEREAMRLPLLVGAATLLLPLALVPLGLDLFLWRNAIGALPPLALVVAATLAPRRARIVGIGVGGVVSLLLLAATIDVFVTPDLQRPDWRAASRFLGPPNPHRVVVVEVPHGRTPFEWYRPRARALTPHGVRATEIDVIGTGSAIAVFHAPTGFRRTETRSFAGLEVERLRATRWMQIRPNVDAGWPVYSDW